jgi:ketosteroid isomerase-like protein
MAVVDNTQIVLTFFAALARGDFAAARAVLAADATWWMPSMGQTSGVSKSGDAIFAECVDYTAIEVRRACGEREYVAVEWVARGASPQGTQYENCYRVITGFTVRDGKIQRIRDHRDLLYAKEVLVR